MAFIKLKILAITTESLKKRLFSKADLPELNQLSKNSDGYKVTIKTIMKKQLPFDFLLDYLPANIVIRPAIGMYYIYWERKIVLMFRKVTKNAQHNGLWIATKREHHTSLKAELPAITDFVFEKGATFDSAWLQLKDDHDDFERASIRICELISHRDIRIGKETPKAAELTR